MARRPHLILRRLEGELDRRKRPGFGGAPDRDNRLHGAFIAAETTSIIRANAQRADAQDDPSVVLRVSTVGYLDEAQLGAMQMTVLSQTGDEAMVVHSPDPELTEFRRRLSAYGGAIPEGQKNPSYAGTFGVIETVAQIRPEERLGPTLISAGLLDPDGLLGRGDDLYDVELWDAADGLHDLHVESLRRVAEEHGGEILSRYRGAGVFLVRVRGDGTCIRAILQRREVASVDFPPVADLAPPRVSDWTLEDLPEFEPPPEGAECIGIVDSGVTAAHPLLNSVLEGAFGVPASLGADDERGHGTAVAGVAAYGSLAEQLRGGELHPRFRLASAKVVDGDGDFDQSLTVPAIIEQAVRRLNEEFGARVINLSLADRGRAVSDRPSPWAATLDSLARELDIIIVVAAGNGTNVSARLADEGLDIYPKYLLDAPSRLFEPGSAINSVVVGSIASSSGLLPEDVENIDIIPLTEDGDLSPFTLAGPGHAGAIKPDFVEYGGTAIWQGFNNTLNADRDSCGILTLDADYTSHLLGYRHGTSFSTPLVAFKAAAILESIPDASANLVRALLGVASVHPSQAQIRFPKRTYFRPYGYGQVNINHALDSEDTRPVLYAEDSLAPDKFAVYEVPIPPEFQTRTGRRHIRVSLAFDPPVRRTRKSYVGIGMGFHLARGVSEQDVFDRFRRWEKEDHELRGEPFEFEVASWQCKMEPIASLRESGTLQVATFVASRSLLSYGDRYFLVVRCEGGWATPTIDRQDFAIAVELWHEAEIELYQAVAVTLTA